MDFAARSLSLKSTVPALEISGDGKLKGGIVDGRNRLDASVYGREDPINVAVGLDSIPSLGLISGSEGRPKAVQGLYFSLTYYFAWMVERFGLSEQDRFTMLSGIAHNPIQMSRCLPCLALMI